MHTPYPKEKEKKLVNKRTPYFPKKVGTSIPAQKSAWITFAGSVPFEIAHMVMSTTITWKDVQDAPKTKLP
jgi:hypothetical protein